MCAYMHKHSWTNIVGRPTSTTSTTGCVYRPTYSAKIITFVQAYYKVHVLALVLTLVLVGLALRLKFQIKVCKMLTKHAYHCIEVSPQSRSRYLAFLVMSLNILFVLSYRISFFCTSKINFSSSILFLW